MNKKIRIVLESKYLLDEIQQNAMDNFKKYHSTEARYQQFLEAIDRIC